MLGASTLHSNIITLYGDQGKEWLLNLPQLTEKFAQEWELSHLSTVTTTTYHQVMIGSRRGRPVVLKLGFDYKAMAREAHALKSFDGYGAVRLLDEREGALLLECAFPGDSLQSLFPQNDLEAIEITCKMVNKLHEAPLPPDGTFPTLRDALSVLDNEWNLPQSTLKKARKLRDQLLANCTAPVLLHGDLHHGNVLKSELHEDGWIVIDPKGIIGEACYDITCFIRNPVQDLPKVQDPLMMIKKRINAFSKQMSIDAHRIANWCYVQSVVAWCWCLEDYSDPHHFKKIVPYFEQMI